MQEYQESRLNYEQGTEQMDDDYRWGTKPFRYDNSILSVSSYIYIIWHRKDRIYVPERSSFFIYDDCWLMMIDEDYGLDYVE